MSRTHPWTWAVVMCLFSAPMVCAQSQPASDGSSGSSTAAVAAVPRLIKFSGAVRDARGELLTSVAVRMTFSVYEEPTGGAALWGETQVVQLDEQGHYTVLLGATRADGLPVELFPAGKARWLGVQVEGRDEDTRVLLVSVPYALKAEDAAMLGGRQASDFVLGEQLKEEVKAQVEAQKPGIAAQAVEMLVSNPPKAPAIAEGPSTFTCATTGDCVAVTQSSTGRALRTTATSASEAVLVQQNGTGYGLRALAPGSIALLGQVTGSAGTSYGVKGQTTSTTGAGVFGYNLATTGLAYGILGQTASTGGTALFGRATALTGATIGLRGHSDSISGTGILGQATATSGVTTGIVGRVFSVDGTALIVDNTQGGKLLSAKVGSAEKFSVNGSGNLAAGGNITATGTLSGTRLVSTVSTGAAPLQVTSTTLVPNLYVSRASSADNSLALDTVLAASYARRDGTNSFSAGQTVACAACTTALSVQATGVVSTQIGIDAVANGPDGSGVIGRANSGTEAVGVWGISSSGQAGLFQGNVSVSGTISAASKDFKIDHPLEPADKYLVHASVESSELKTIYDGTVVLDGNGEALVQLPNWFEALNGDFRYQLTCVGGYAPVYIAQKIRSNSFKIAGGRPELEVSWQVTGVRHDAYARAHPLVVEAEKPARDRGYYLHPELHGAAQDKAVEWAQHPEQMRLIREREQGANVAQPDNP